MRIGLIVVAGVLAVLVIWQGVHAQEEASSPCWTVIYGAIQEIETEPEAIFLNQCTGATWRRGNYRDAWRPIGW